MRYRFVLSHSVLRHPFIIFFPPFPPHSQHGTLMRYVLDELYYYEHDHSDALAPTSQEAGQSLAGEAALVRPATTEALNMAQASLSAEIQAAFNKLSAAQLALTEGQLALTKDIRSLREQFGSESNHLQPPDPCTPTSTSTSASLSNPSRIQPGQIVTIDGSGMSSFFLLTRTLAMDSPLIHILPSIPVRPNILLASGVLHVVDRLALALALALTCACAPHSSSSPGHCHAPCQVLVEHTCTQVCRQARANTWAGYPKAAHRPPGWDARAQVPVLEGPRAALDGGGASPRPPHAAQGLASGTLQRQESVLQ